MRHARRSWILQPLGRGHKQVGAEIADRVVVMVDEDVPERLARVVVERLDVAEGVEPANQLVVHVPSGAAEYLFLPLAEVGRPDPQGTLDAQHPQAGGALVEEHVLTREGAETFTEEHYPRPALRRPLVQALVQRQPQLAVLDAALVDTVER